MGIFLVTDTATDPKTFKNPGNRYPGVFFHGKNKHTQIRHSIGSELNDLVIKEKELLAVDTPISFRICQEMEDGTLMYKVEIGGEEKLSAEQTEAFEGAVDVYVASPVHPPVPGSLQNLKLVLKG